MSSGATRGRSGLRGLWRAPSGRLTNLKLLVALALAYATGVGAVATGSPRGGWIVIAHGVAAMAIVLLVPWKTRVARAGMRRARPSRWLSIALAALTIVTLVFGFGYATGLVSSVGGVAGMWLHVAFALALVPLAVWHLLARRVRPRREDLGRRAVLRAGLVAAAGGGLYAATAAVVHGLALPGTDRRFSGSYETGSFTPAAMPNTIWLADTAPRVDAQRWRLSVAGAGTYTLGELEARTETRRATLDCTSGWYAEQDWTGVPVSALLPPLGSARSLKVTSVTGYWIRLPVRDLDTLLLATRVGGSPLSVGHGYPLRLVAPGRRGYWWVKWVARIELQDTPWWWQPPFPVT